MLTSDKIKGMFLGTFIGDALGMPVEMFEPERIAKTYGRVTTMLAPTEHKWFKGQPAGIYTDDTQLTLAVARSMIDSEGLNILSQIDHHVRAMNDSTAGWGGTTKEAVRRLSKNIHYLDAARVDSVPGTGNGTAMKVSPIGAWAAFNEESEIFDFTMLLSKMTHKTNLAAAASMAQMQAVRYCIHCDKPEDFQENAFISQVCYAAAVPNIIFDATGEKEVLAVRLKLMAKHAEYDQKRIIEEFKGGCYCYESIPLTLMFFIKNPTSIETLYDVVNAGGDTDSNASMVGALLGALNGTAIFPKHLVDGLSQVQLKEVMEVADKFIETFGLW